jgi:thioesterase domain-containing protein
MGGLVALEMAQQLLEQGKKVDLLILIETWPPCAIAPYGILASNAFAKFRLVRQVIARNWNALRKLDSTRRWGYIWEKLKRNVHSEDTVRVALGQVASANTRAALNYVPRFYSGKTCLILAADRPLRGNGDPRLHWQQLMAPGLDVYLSSGKDSGLMLSSPNIENLGLLIKELIHKVSHRVTALILFATTHYWLTAL